MKGKPIEQYRRMIGISQTVVAHHINIALSTYCNKINGNTSFNQPEMAAVTDLFKKYIPQITLEDIFFKEEVNHELTCEKELL